jgi:predicted DNA-binding transcriptional regulator YafY
MNRTDRLVAMVMFLQGRRVVRAEELAAHFEISVRTVYRDIVALSEAGVPVAGEAGIGYSLVRGYHLPPVMFTADEAMALFVGSEMVRHFTDASLEGPTMTALLKIRSVLPRERQDDVDRLGQSMVLEERPVTDKAIDKRVLLPLQQAIVARRVLRLVYRARGGGEETVRDVEPLGVTYYGGAWYLVGWCRLRKDFRQFKLARLKGLTLLDEIFKPRPGFSLRHYLEESTAKTELLPATVWFSDAVVERARRESYFGFKAERPADGGIEAEMLTFSYGWLARWVLWFAGEAEIIAPESAREEARLYAGRTAARHACLEPKRG